MNDFLIPRCFTFHIHQKWNIIITMTMTISKALLWMALAAIFVVFPRAEGPRVAVASGQESSAIMSRISYNDLLDLFGSMEDDEADDDALVAILQQNTHKIARLLKTIEEAFSKRALGFLEVTSLPTEIVSLRQKLLPRAEELANLPANELLKLEQPDKGYSFGWSHGKESFKVQEKGETKRRYDIAKGSFYMNPYANDQNVYPESLQPHLEDDLLRMTRFMATVGLWIAILCDLYLGTATEECPSDANASDNLDIVSSISSNPWMVYKSLKYGKASAKARLLYYFPQQEETNAPKEDVFDDWCGWHTDHGSLTALLPGMLTGASHKNSLASDSPKPGLYIKTINETERLVHVDLAQDSLGFQLGETLEILSEGRFEATPHAVKAPQNLSMGRASLAVFLQPRATQILPQLKGKEDDDILSLSNRWRSTFGEFQRVTIESFS